MNLLPCPRVLKRAPGFYRMPAHARLGLDGNDPELLQIAQRFQAAAKAAGVELSLPGVVRHSRRSSYREVPDAVHFRRSQTAPAQSEGYEIAIDSRGIQVEYRDLGGLRAAVATLRQLLREFGRRLPCLRIRDWPDFPRRGVMLDISRGRVPRLETLFELVDQLADFKTNEFQLYLEHTFAYRNYRPVWGDWGALTGREMARLDARCRELGIDLVPNQNSFGHLRQWLAYPPLRKLAEVDGPYESEQGDFLRHPSTLAPNHPGTLPLLREFYDELLPNFTSEFFNVGCDETWDLGRGQSKALCERKGKGRVYLDFLKEIHREVSARGRRMMFWGDIILKYPRLIRELASWGVPPSGGTPNLVALNWGYEANHPFDREARRFARSGVPFYVCPGTSSWMTLIGRHDNALANLRRAAAAGRRHGARGYLITDWGDGGHPQPLAVSYLPYLAGASLSWCAKSFDPTALVPVLSRDVFSDPTRRLASAALALGLAHRRFRFREPNATPFGTTLAAPPPEWRELYCRNGLTHYRRIAGTNVRAALAEVERQLARMQRSRPAAPRGRQLAVELKLAARMAAHSCKFMLWQQALETAGDQAAGRLAGLAIRELRKLDREFSAFWAVRNKGTPKKCAAFLRWRMADYEREATPSSRGLRPTPR